MKSFINSVDPGSTFTEEDSWWLGASVTCGSCGTIQVFQEGDEVTARVQDGKPNISVKCQGRRCARDLWLFKDTVDDAKKEAEFTAAVTEALAAANKAVPSLTETEGVVNE